MRNFFRSAAVGIVLICCYLSGFSQGSTSKGTEFWTAYMANSNPPGSDMGSVMFLYITSDVNTSGVVTLKDKSYTQLFQVTANKITTITIPATAFINAQGTFDKGIHITSLQPVAVYAHIFAENSSGATLLLPVPTLGKDYYSINYIQKSNQKSTYSAFMVIATEDNTTVEITPTATLLDGKAANQTFQVKLNTGQVYQGLSSTDLTGTRISSTGSDKGACSKIAVFSGSTRIYIGCISTSNKENISSDNLFQQVYPTASWGKNYITVPLKKRNYDIFRIVLNDSNTKVQLNGTPLNSTAFVNGLYYEFNSDKPNVISADKPIQIVQYAVTQGSTLTCGSDANDVGDPEMIYLTPLEQTVDHVTLFSANNFLILNSYINVLLKTNQVATFLLDGVHYSTFTPVPGNPAYSYAQISVASGTHSISAAIGFNAIAYGFGVHESYGYAAGTNLQDLNSFVALQPRGTNLLLPNGCTGVGYNLLLNLPYQPSVIIWDMKDGTAPVTDVNPQAQVVQRDDQTLYLYKYPKSPINVKAGKYIAVATATNPNTTICGSTLQYELDYTISDPPTAKFGVSDACLDDPATFTDQSAISVPVKTWSWDFGDGQPASVSQNSTHKYASPGDYTVSLAITDVDGCTSVASQKVHIYAKPKSEFTAPVTGCIGQNIVFANNSSTTEGKIVKWIWDFGDGGTNTFDNSTASVNHTYTQSGTYIATLTVVSDNSCTSQPYSQSITIGPLAEVDFLMPDICEADPFALFTNKSTIADGTEPDLIYHWDFGDNNNKVDPNISTEKDGKHHYSAAGTYTVTLSVQSKYGCISSKTRSFTVNSNNPIVDFAPENTSSLCSGNDIVFVDKSSVVTGAITKIVWYFDYNNDPLNAVTFNKADIPVDRKYRHTYNVTELTQKTHTYEVREVAYTGETCFNTTDKYITINTSPVVSLLPTPDICQGANPVQLGINTNGFIGTGVFSGPGVSPQGLFNPTIAGPGIASISYTFTSAGCDYTTSEQINIIPDPTVSAEPVVTMLEGIPITLNATAEGNSLTYKWTPSIGLNQDNVLNPIVNATDNTNYVLTVTSADHCTAQASVLVKVLKNIIVPNAFTPNGDGINDTWMIKYIDKYPGCTVDIFNRYGQKVFTSINYNQEWDGKYKGNYLPSGTYYYIINLKNGRTTVSGSVTIIR